MLNQSPPFFRRLILTLTQIALLLTSPIISFSQIPLQNNLPLKFCRVIAVPTGGLPLEFTDKVIIAPQSGGNLKAFNQTDGKLLWESELGGDFVFPPVLDSERVLIVTSTTSAPPEKTTTTAFQGTKKNYLRALSVETGITLWQNEFNFPEKPETSEFLQASVPLIAQKLIVIPATNSIHAYNTADGKLRWQISLPAAPVAAPEFDPVRGKLYFLTAAKQLYTVRIENGDFTSKPFAGAIQTTGVVTGLMPGAIVSGDQIGNIYAVALASNKIIWRTRVGAAVSQILFFDNCILVLSNDNFAYLYKAADGKNIWQRRLETRPRRASLLNENTVVITLASGENNPLLNLADGKPTFNINLGRDNYATGAAVPLNRRLFIPTLRGLAVFAGRDDGCSTPVFPSGQ